MLKIMQAYPISTAFIKMSIERVFNKCLQETIRDPTLKFAHMVDTDVVNKIKIIIKILKNVIKSQGQEVQI